MRWGVIAGIWCSLAAAAAAQAPKLEFDVASVKLNNADGAPSTNLSLGPGDGYVPTGGNFTATAFPSRSTSCLRTN